MIRIAQWRQAAAFVVSSSVACLLGACSGGLKDPPGDGWVILEIDRQALRDTVLHLGMRVDGIAVFYAPVPPPTSDAGVDGNDCTSPEGTLIPLAEPIDIDADLTQPGTTIAGSFPTRPGSLYEIRLLLGQATLQSPDGTRPLRPLAQCRVEQLTFDVGPGACGSKPCRKGELRLIASAPAGIEVISNANVWVKANFDPHRDLDLRHLKHCGIADDHGHHASQCPPGLQPRLTSHLVLEAAPPPISVATAPPPQFEAHQAYVMFNEGTPLATIASAHGQVGATVITRNRRHPWDVVRLPTGLSETAAVATYRAMPSVRLAMLNYNALRANAFPEEWPKDGSGTPTTIQWWLQKTESPAAWDAKPPSFVNVTGGSYVPIVAVVDSDMNVFNPDLQENIFLNPGEIPTTVVRKQDCTPLMAPVSLSTVHTAPADGSEPDDNIITLADLNREPNRTAYNTVLRTTQNRPTRALDARIELVDLIEPDGPKGQSPACGLWENGVDDELPTGNGHVDDIVGWDFITDRNLPLEFVPTAGSGPSAVTLPSGTTLNNSGHALTVAATLGAVNNAKSIFSGTNRLAADYVGQAWRVRILPVRVLAGLDTLSQGTTGTIHAGLEYAKSLNADVINMSFSLICAPDREEVPVNIRCSNAQIEDKKKVYRESFDVAGIDTGVLLVVGAIDAPVDLDDPTIQDLPAELGLPNQLTVSATTQDDKHGSAMDDCQQGVGPKQGAISWGINTYQIAAPGRCMRVLNYGGAGQLSDGVDGEATGGTSLSAPQVAGVAALILSVEPSLRGSPTVLRDRILRNADSLDALSKKIAGGRRLNARKAVLNEVP